MFMFKLAEVGGGKKERKKGPGAGAGAARRGGASTFFGITELAGSALV